MIKLDSSEKSSQKGREIFLVIWFSKSTSNLRMFYLVESLFRKKTIV